MNRFVSLLLLVLLALPTPVFASFPHVVAVNSSTETGDETTHNVDSSGVIARELLILLVGFDFDPGAITKPTGWSYMTGALSGVGGTPGTTITGFYKIADGTEGATEDVVTANAQRSAHQLYRITGYHPMTPPQIGFTGGGAADTAANPPSLNPTNWNIEDTLWIIGCVSDADTVFSADPASYTNAVENNSGSTTDGAKLRTLRRESAVESEDPGVFTNTSRQWNCATIAVRPGSGGPSGFALRAFRGGP